MRGQRRDDQLRYGLKNRHIQLIALSDMAGTGSFLGSAFVIRSVGLGIILGYITAGFIAFLIMRQLGKAVVEEPVADSFNYFACKYWGGFAGLSSGQNYWVLYALVVIAGLTVVGKYIQFWHPEIPTWVSATTFFMLINAISLTNVEVLDEVEFWLAIVKVIAVIAMILFDDWLPFSDSGGPQASVSNLWDQGGFLPHGFTGLVMTMAIIMFFFDGLELVGITAVEADSPEQSIPKVTSQAIYRILIFYVGSLTVLLSLVLWTRVMADTSSSILIFHELSDTFVANVLNIVVLATIPSVYDSCVYYNSHMLFGLAQQSSTPKVLMNVDKRDVPVDATLVSALVTALYMLISYLAPGSVFSLLMALVVSALMINWAVVSLVRMESHRAEQQQSVTTRFPTLLYPLGNWVCLIFVAAILVTTLMTPGMAISVYLIPVWIVILGVGYLCEQKVADTAKTH